METAEEKLAFFGNARASAMAFDAVRPDEKGNWLNVMSNDFEDQLPLIDKEAKASTKPSGEKAIFKLYSNGINTARDDWVTDLDADLLRDKVQFFLREYARHGATSKELGGTIKWSRNLKTKLSRGTSEVFDSTRLRRYAYRPFLPQFGYLSKLVIDELGQWPSFDGTGNRTINFPAAKEFFVLASDLPTDFHFTGDTKVAALYRFDATGNRIDNVTDWALKEFRKHYQSGRKSSSEAAPSPQPSPRGRGGKGKGDTRGPLSKEAIFHFVYAVLHDPVYREKYTINLKREFPRIPMYGGGKAGDAAFWQWADWGAALMDLHLNYETVAPLALARIDTPDAKARAAGVNSKVVLKSDPEGGRIVVDSEPVLADIPRSAWDYRLGNRSALDWVLDQHKEKKPKDPTIRAKFDTYRFADNKEKVIDLLMRVARVSVETVAIVEAMKRGVR